MTKAPKTSKIEGEREEEKVMPGIDYAAQLPSALRENKYQSMDNFLAMLQRVPEKIIADYATLQMDDAELSTHAHTTSDAISAVVLHPNASTLTYDAVLQGVHRNGFSPFHDAVLGFDLLISRAVDEAFVLLGETDGWVPRKGYSDIDANALEAHLRPLARFCAHAENSGLEGMKTLYAAVSGRIATRLLPQRIDLDQMLTPASAGTVYVHALAERFALPLATDPEFVKHGQGELHLRNILNTRDFGAVATIYNKSDSHAAAVENLIARPRVGAPFRADFAQYLKENHPALVGMPIDWIWNALAPRSQA